MTGLLICAAVVAFAGANTCASCGVNLERGNIRNARAKSLAGFALTAAALYLAWRAGGVA